MSGSKDVGADAGAPFELAVGTADEMVELGRAIAQVLRAGDVVCLEGPLGAGKTTLTRGIGEGLGVGGGIASPTYVLARRHPGSSVDLLHCDAYRVPDPIAFDDLDLDTSGAVTVIEWGRPVMGAVADSWLTVAIDRPEGTSGEERKVLIAGHGDRWNRIEMDRLAGVLRPAHRGRP